ncbi:MAG: hypothetical protein QN597_08295 [Nitrososphaeraceae archaeon]|nr:hypothetical protein [Nitrososphaeraceae archaeon]
MNKDRFTISTTLGIASVLLLIAGLASISILNTTHAQSATLGEPFFVEEGKVTGQKEIGPYRTQYTIASNGTMNDNIQVTNTGEYVSISKGNNLVFDQGEGVIKTKDGSETANHTFIEVGNGTDYHGASVYSTNSTGKLSFLNNIVVIFKGGYDENGNYSLQQWHWK